MARNSRQIFPSSSTVSARVQNDITLLLRQRHRTGGTRDDDFTIRGQEVNVIVREGRGNNLVMRQLVTAFEGKNGTVLVMIQGNASGWDEALINEFLSSIQ